MLHYSQDVFSIYFYQAGTSARKKSYLLQVSALHTVNEF